MVFVFILLCLMVWGLCLVDGKPFLQNGEQARNVSLELPHLADMLYFTIDQAETQFTHLIARTPKLFVYTLGLQFSDVFHGHTYREIN